MPPKNWVKKAVSSAAPVSRDSMQDPDTRLNIARHEAGHAVVDEALNPGSLVDTTLSNRGGLTTYQPIKDRADIMATSLAGGLSEPGGTTITHSGPDRDLRNKYVGEMASTPMMNLYRKLTGSVPGHDPMLEAPQMQSEGLARYSALMANPKVRDSVDEVAGRLNDNLQLSGDDVRGIMGR